MEPQSMDLCIPKRSTVKVKVQYSVHLCVFYFYKICSLCHYQTNLHSKTILVSVSFMILTGTERDAIAHTG